MEEWRGTINGIIYGLQFGTELTDESAAEMANAMVEERFFTGGPERYVEAITAALASSAAIDDFLHLDHTDDEMRAFLAKVLAELRDPPQARRTIRNALDRP